MAYSSILGADKAPSQPSGRDSDALGPSDNSDTGSDAIGTYEALADSDAAGTGERGSVTPGDGADNTDILPDHVVEMSAEELALATGRGFPEGDPDAREFTDLDGDADADPDADDEA
jgi:hypothetical protein